ncbi:transposase [Novacetimonas hansenii]|uniref:transposase n=1 Tax=Novacetimonas hansenii TaxID=436 RepID=UPI0038D069CC
MRPDEVEDAGGHKADRRLFVNGCLCILRSGVHWTEVPEQYGKWETVHRRFSRWCHDGAGARFLRR